MTPSRPEKLRHLAVCLPMAGLFLLMPPALSVFGIDTNVIGIPLIVLYIFGIWAVLIISASLLAHHLKIGGNADPVPDDEAVPGVTKTGHDGDDPGHRL